MEIKTTHLTGRFLDWAVANSMGVDAEITENGTLKLPCGEVYSPSTNWSQGGKLIEKYRLEIVFDGSRNEGWRCVKDWCYGEVNDTYPLGETHLIAACRAIVAAKLGYVVQVPADLIGAAA